MLAIALTVFGFVLGGIKVGVNFIANISFISNLSDIVNMGIEQIFGGLMNELTANVFNFNLAINFVTFFLILFAGFVIGKVASHLVYKGLMHLKINDYIHAGEHFKFEVAHISSLFVKWILYLAFVSGAVEALEISSLTGFFGTIVGFLSDLLGAGAVILISFGLGVYVKDHVIGDTSHHADIVGKLIMYVFLFLGISIGLEVALPGKTALIANILTILVASVGLGVAIALGFGLKDVVGKMAEDYAHEYKEKSKKHKARRKH